MTIQEYIDSVNKRYKLGNATEHTFRGDLQQLIESLVPNIRATNEPKRQSCGAPDYILTKMDASTGSATIPVGFIEAKDIGDKDLAGEKKTGNKEQFDRYKASLNNLFFTDYIDFHLYRDGQFVTKIAIAELTDKGIKPLPENFASFERLLKDFCTHIGQTITSSKKLAEMMASKARLLSEVIEKALTSDETHNEDSTLKDQMTAFKQILIHDITPKGFADVYAQTIAYGMFAARYHDPTLPTFSRQEAYELIPKSNPFLKKLFGYIAGLDVDDRIKWIVDDLINIFLACNVEEMLKNYGKATKTEDPIIHFYEDFLSQYDPKLRKARGVWYTPAPVVNFIVRAVDDILKTEFDLPQGLADTSKTKIKVEVQGKKIEQEVHKAQILDPATGTGTFLAETVKHIHKNIGNQQGIWSNYVEKHLLPRLNGFELLMASYAMAHLKLDLLLTDTGYEPTTNQRLRVYLTNSLEEHHPDTGTLFANWLSAEANEANHIKRDAPVMVVLGNPPYSVSSTNKSEWIEKLTADYKKDLNERNIQPLSDDYVKFIRLGQHFIEKTSEGILAYISNNSFIDGIIHRKMREELMKTFDKIYILDLHGNAKKKEVCPDGSADQNVFDIMQGVSINIFVKTRNKKKAELGQTFHFDLHGKRQDKYNFLRENSLNKIQWNKLKPYEPNYFFVKKDFDETGVYEKGFKVDELFDVNNVGIVTARDNFTIHHSKNGIENLIKTFLSIDNETARSRFNLGKDARDWKVELAKKDLQINFPNKGIFLKTSHRPFDDKWTFYTGKSKGFHSYPRFEVMKHLLQTNIALVTPKQAINGFQHVFISKNICDKNYIDSAGQFGAGNIFPLYLYPDNSKQEEQTEHRNNLEAKVEEARIISENFEISFLKVKKMYEAIPNPDAEMKKYFKSQEAFGQKLKANIDKFRQEIASLPSLTLFEEPKRKPNLNMEIVKLIANELDLTFTNEKDTSTSSGSVQTFAPIDILDYIYAVLHSPSYREKYKEFLKIDFPRVPYPKDAATFWQLVKLGGELRQIHLLESPTVENYITQYPEDGNNMVVKPRAVETLHAKSLRIYINDTQYFDNVPEVAWNFYIGGYQPAQKWLKDRKDRKLEFDDILHYQKIIVALSETDRLMKEIDTIENEQGKA